METYFYNSNIEEHMKLLLRQIHQSNQEKLNFDDFYINSYNIFVKNFGDSIESDFTTILEKEILLTFKNCKEEIINILNDFSEKFDKENEFSIKKPNFFFKSDTYLKSMKKFKNIFSNFFKYILRMFSITFILKYCKDAFFKMNVNCINDYLKNKKMKLKEDFSSELKDWLGNYALIMIIEVIDYYDNKILYNDSKINEKINQINSQFEQFN